MPSVDMCPIGPGKSSTYVFTADQAGTSWWHSHYDAQVVDGLWGPMIIEGYVQLIAGGEAVLIPIQTGRPDQV